MQHVQKQNDVVSVEPRPDYTLLLEFANHEKRVFDMRPYLTRPYYAALKGPRFQHARVSLGSVRWPGDIDISPETLYRKSLPL